MKQLRQWVRWELEPDKDGNPTKVPYQVNGKKASSTDPNRWTDYRTAVTGATIDASGGVGFVVNGDGIFGIDLDGCYNPKTGKIAEWAERIIDACKSYTEYTPSETGLRVWARGVLPAGLRVFNLDPAVGYGEKVKIEIYEHSRYFTVTGDAFFEESGIEEIDTAAIYQMLHDIRAQHPAPVNQKTAEKSAAADDTTGVQIVYAPGSNIKIDKHAIFMRGQVVKDGSGFHVTLNNKDGLAFATVTYPSQSEADLGFATVLALIHDGDVDKMDDDFRKSALYREKWEREDYRERTFTKALETGEKIRKEKVLTVQEPTPSTPTVTVATSTDTVVTALTPSVIPGDEIPAFDESAITGIYRDIVDAATNGTTIPRQFAFLAARVYIGAMIAGKITFEGMEDTSSYYGVPIGLSGTSKGLAWKRTVDDILSLPNLALSVKILEGSGDSGAGLKDFFFDEPRNAPVVCMIDEAISLGHKAGDKKNPEILDAIVELATKHKFTRVKAARGKGKAGRSHDNAHLSIYLCAQDKEVIAAAFPNRRGMGLFERFYGEYSAPIIAGRLPKVDTLVATKIWEAVQKLPKSGHMTMAAGVEERIESYWASLPRDVQTKVRLKSHLYRDMYMAAHGRGSMIAEMRDLDSTLVNFPRQIKIREAFFTTEVPDKIGLYLSRLKAITESMRRRLNSGEPVWAVALSQRDFQTDTLAYKNNELHFFDTAWRSWLSQMMPVKIKKTNGHEYDKFAPKPLENEEGMWK